MAKKKSGWNSLSNSQQQSFKAVNFDKSIKVSESTIKGLRAGKTFEGNVAKFKTGATTEQREAMNRFYGKARVDTALGSPVSSVNKTYSNPGPSFKGVSSTNYTSPKTSPISKGSWHGSNPFGKGNGSVNATPGKSAGGLGKWLTTPSDFSLGGAYRAARGQKAKYGSEANQQKALAVVSLVPGVRIARGAKVAVTAVKGASKIAPKAIEAGKVRKAIGPGPLGPKAPIALPAGPVGRAAAKSAVLDAKHAAAVTRSKAATEALKNAAKQQRRGLLTSGEVKAVAKTAELERINVGIVANAARASRGLKPRAVKVGPVFKKPTTSRSVSKPAGSGITKAADLPTSKPQALGKAPKTAKKAPTPKQRLKANTTDAKEMRKAIAPGASRVTPAGSRSRVSLDTKTEVTRARLTARLEKKGDAYRQELRSKYAGGKSTEQRAWEKRVAKQGGGPKSGASITAASKDAAKRGVEVTVGKSKEAAKAARPKKVAKKVAKKTTTRGKK